MKIYAAEYNPIIFESSYGTISLHKTREGAEKAIEQHKNATIKEWKKSGFDGVRDYEKWQVRELKVLE